MLNFQLNKYYIYVRVSFYTKKVNFELLTTTKVLWQYCNSIYKINATLVILHGFPFHCQMSLRNIFRQKEILGGISSSFDSIGSETFRRKVTQKVLKKGSN